MTIITGFLLNFFCGFVNGEPMNFRFHPLAFVSPPDHMLIQKPVPKHNPAETIRNYQMPAILNRQKLFTR